MTAPASPATHTVPNLGTRVPVTIVGPSTLGNRPAIRVKAIAGTPFHFQGMNGCYHADRADFPPGCVHPLHPAPATQDTEADAELRFGLVLLDARAEAPEVNAALSEWRAARGYSDPGDDAPEFPDGEFGEPFTDDVPYIPRWFDDERDAIAEDAAAALYELQADREEV